VALTVTTFDFSLTMNMQVSSVTADDRNSLTLFVAAQFLSCQGRAFAAHTRQPPLSATRLYDGSAAKADRWVCQLHKQV
jgi:hypothetical protein